MMADNSDGLFCCIFATQTLCTDGFLFTSMMIDLVEKLSCANCFLATIFRRYLNIGILAHFCLAGSDVSVVDCPTQLTLVIWICRLSRRWGPFKRGSKMFEASLQPGKDIWGQFFGKMYLVCP